MTTPVGITRTGKFYVFFIAAVLLLPAGAVAETISFPSHSSDLPTDSYWTVSELGEGCCALDLNKCRVSALDQVRMPYHALQ